MCRFGNTDPVADDAEAHVQRAEIVPQPKLTVPSPAWVRSKRARSAWSGQEHMNSLTKGAFQHVEITNEPEKTKELAKRQDLQTRGFSRQFSR